MTENSENVELTDEELDEYFDIAFAMGNTTGFSKGTANVSARDLKKLKPLIKFYAKKPHPFRACVKDNEKRFGALVNKYCAIIKDLIEGNTKWRKGGNKSAKGTKLSDETLFELFALDIPHDFITFLSELDDDEIEAMMTDETDSTEFAQGDVAWEASDSYNSLIDKLEKALNGVDTVPGQDYSSGYGGMKFWIKDVTDSKALVCEGGTDYYVVGFTLDKKGDLTVDPEEDWKSVTQAWVEDKVGLSDEPGVMAEMFFSTKEKKAKADNEGLIWKPIMRAGTWKFSPSKEGAAPKTLTITKTGSSNRKKLTISMSELKKNFEEGAVEHVTIPASHADTVLENTGFIRKLRFAKDEEGRDVLEAGMDFTEPDVKEKAERGTIANTSAGVLFDYIHKEKGTKFRSVLAHAALTNRPWLNGMKPFGVNASDDLEVIGFSEEINDPANPGGGEVMSEVAYDFSALGFDSEEDLKVALSEAKALKAKSRERDVADLCKAWQEDGKAPALVAEAQTIMMSDDGATVLNLSEDGKDVGLSASDIVKRLIDKSTSVKLDQDPVNDKDATGEKEEETNLSEEERLLASQLYFDGGYSMKDAEVEAKKRLAKASDKS
jgi:hypothetical protein